MKEKDVRIGMKVIPHSKLNGIDNLEDSVIFRKMIDMNQKFLYVTEIKDSDKVCIIYQESIIFVLAPVNQYGGDFYYASDFEPYLKTERKNKLKKILSI